MNRIKKSTDFKVSSSEVSYFCNIRSEIAEYVKMGRNQVLDVGCGAGYFSAYLKTSGRAAKTIGIEVDVMAAKEAITKMDQVLCANLNQTDVFEVLKAFDKASFDYIVCADVLEHLINPWEVLAKLVTYLKPSGRVVLCIPNARHWSVWLPLILRGHFVYREAGIMDRTHLRFFTRLSAIELLNGAGLDLSIYQPLIGGKWRLLNKFSMGLLEELVAVQLVFVASRR